MAYMAAAGLLLGAGGAFLGGKAGDIVRDRLNDIAKTPGLDTGKITGQALDDELKYLDRASQVASGVSKANQAALTAQEEAALPGVGASRQNALGRINSLFADDQAWLEGVQRRGAALGLSSGLFGSQAGQIRTLKLSDQEQMQRTQLGTGLLSSLIGGLRIADSPGVQNFLSPTPNQLINIRGQERAQKMAYEAQAAGVPGQTAAWGNYLTQTGGLLTGAGAMSLGGGFGGGAGASSSSAGGAVNSMGGSWNTPYFNYEDSLVLHQRGLK